MTTLCVRVCECGRGRGSGRGRSDVALNFLYYATVSTPALMAI